MPHQHKAGSLKQKNKRHGGSGNHSSKRALKRAQGGKVNASSGKVGSGLSAASKLQRLQQTKQLRQQKRAREWLDRRTGTRMGAPIIVLLLPIGHSADVASLAASLVSALNIQ